MTYRWLIVCAIGYTAALFGCLCFCVSPWLLLDHRPAAYLAFGPPVFAGAVLGWFRQIDRPVPWPVILAFVLWLLAVSCYLLWQLVEFTASV